jgi:beta-N-acetylhexosaminidase
LFVVGFEGLTATEDIRTLIRAPYYVGSVILFQRNVESAEQLTALTNELQQIARSAGHERPLLIGIDQENGVLTRIKPQIAAQLPGSMALGATGSVTDAARVSRATGELLTALGINMNYAPCCDVNSDPLNPVIGTRSPGDDGEFVGRIASAIARGLRESNIIPCVKHFPGHGSTSVDSHYGLPVMNQSWDELESLELIPFRRAIAEGIEAMMTAHIAVASMDGSGLPVSVSKKALGILRGELQYDGLIVSDCLEMDAVRSGVGTEKGAAMAISAGTDCAMICHTFSVQVAAYEEVYDACRSGAITPEQIAKSVSRVCRLKDRFLSWDAALKALRPSDVNALLPAHQELASEVYGRSTTVVRDMQVALPLSANSTIVYIGPVRKLPRMGAVGSGELLSEARSSPDMFLGALRQHNPHTREIYGNEDYALDEAALAEVSQADVVIFTPLNAILSPAQTAMGLTLAKLAKCLVVVATGGPYDFVDVVDVKTLLVTYEPTLEAFRSAARVLFGECSPAGVMPVLDTRPKVQIRTFDSERDLGSVIGLWHQLLPQYAVPSGRLANLLARPNGNHFSSYSEGKLIGFVATYGNRESSTGFISALIVHPEFRGRGIGTSLLSHARQYLRTGVKARSVMIGSSIPRFWPGVPFDIPEEHQSFFVHRGFCPFPGPSHRDYSADLTTYEPPNGLLKHVADAGITYIPWRKDLYDETMRNQNELFGKNVVWVQAFERLAQEDQYSQVLVAVDSTGRQVGWTLMLEPDIGLQKDLAFPALLGEKTGQIACVGVHPDARNKGVGLALVATAALNLKSRGMERVFIDWVVLVGWYEKAGFEVWRQYRPMKLAGIA